MREEKTLLLKEIKDQIDSSGSFVILSYKGFNANKANDFRVQVAELGGSLEMVPKRILVKAAGESGIEIPKDKLPGHIGLVLTGAEPFAIAKFVCKYSSDSSDTVAVIGGRFEGQLYSGSDVQKLANLPSMDEMRSQFVGLLEAPMVAVVSTMDSILSSIILCLENKAKKEAEPSEESKN